MAVEMGHYLADARSGDVSQFRTRHGEAFVLIAERALAGGNHLDRTALGRPERPGNTDLILPTLRRNDGTTRERLLVHPVVRKDGGSGEVTVGRSSRADICIPDSSVSRIHATLTAISNGRFRITDLGSRNGTYLGRRELDANSPQLIPPGQTVQFGNIATTFMTAAQFIELLHEAFGES